MEYKSQNVMKGGENLMKKCKSCKSEIDSKATKCPHCQADQRGWFRRHPILTGILVLIVLFVVIGVANGGGSKNTSQPAAQSNPQSQQTATPEQINVKDLADDFDNNQVAAESKWKNKLVQFTAQISNITDMGMSFTNIASKQFSLTQVSCRIQDKQQLLPLKNGQTVTVKGIIGGQTIGVIDMSSCEVVK